ncbi:hypothetical protein FBU30_003219 [Linnemannia zychae]|nr:hypothetical protein FBU30_003219 [Linnemannia zychae]
MGVFGEKHTSLTREQKRQLIHQADTHKLRPTEVCDWVQATWGLRIARVTVYSILHKQRASLMAGHKDLYQTVQSSIGGLAGSNTSDGTGSTNTYASVGECLDRNKETGRVNKYRASPNKNKNKNKDATATNSTANGSENSASAAVATATNNTNTTTTTTATTKANSRKSTESTQAKKTASNGSNNTTMNKRDRSSSVASDRSSSSTSTAQDGLEAGTRWEGQLKRVREPASVELDRAMVEFLKSPASVDSQGRRLNDAELQSHALRLAQSIPSASRMRCSFGWLRHFKRRLGVQWAADRLGRYRWIVEMDRQPGSDDSSFCSSAASTPSPSFSKDATKVKQESNDDNSQFDDDVEEEYHSTNEFSETSSPKKRPTSPSLYNDNSVLGVQSIAPQLQQQHSPQSILDSYPNLFGALPPLYIPGTATTMGTISPLATSLDPKLTANNLSTGMNSTSAFGMSVDGKMRKVPTKEEAYEMLQSLLMYYEQDHSYIGEQQTLLLPRWIHQQRQIMQQINDNDPKMMWLRQSNAAQQQQQPLQPSAQPFLYPYQSMAAMQPMSTEPQHPYHDYHSSFSSSCSSSSSPPALSPISPMSPLSPESPTLSAPFSLGPVLGGLQNDPFVSSTAKADLTFSSAMDSLEHQMLGGHPAFSA